MLPRPAALVIFSATLLGTLARAQTVADSVVITGTRVAEPSAELPMAVDQIGQRQIQEGQLQVNLSETLNSIPGVNAQQRQNYAQDLQLSMRGFGARSAFGVRGVRLYADGIPGTMPDGQGQFSHFDLGSAGRIEVLRGPFSALYGNSSGGVIAIFTQDAPPGARIDAIAQAGSFGTRRYALKVMGEPGGVNFVVNAAHFATDGFRDHSTAVRDTVNARARWQSGERSKLTLVANAVDMPESQDPLGLTRAQLGADPRQAGSNALAYDTRKSVRQEQAGATYEAAVGRADDLTAMVYAGRRRTTQFQAIPQAVELARATHPGGVIDLGRSYWGADVHYTARGLLSRDALQLTGGISFDNLDEARRGFLNFAGNVLGVQGALRRDESNRVYDLDEYLQAQWDAHGRWRTLVGVRNDLVDVRSHDRLAGMIGGGDSSVRYNAVNPVAGVTYRAAAGVDIYGTYGRGFETPTLSDLAYRSTDGSLPGLNLALRPARSDNYELGVKSATARLRVTLAGFYVNTRDELAVQSSSGGRTVFANIVATWRKGVELGAEGALSPVLTGRFAFTHIDAVTSAGHRLPAVPVNTFYAALTWRDQAQRLAVTFETLGRARIYVDDRNSDAADGYWVENLHCDLTQERRTWQLRESLRIDNLADRRYVGSVIVNESNSRYFEPEPGRSVLLMVSVEHR